MKKLLLILLTIVTLFAGDARLKNIPQAQEWEKIADSEGYAAYNLGHTYHTKIKDYEKAIQWYKKAYVIGDKTDKIKSSNNLGALYKEQKNFQEAIKWYKKSINSGDVDALYNLALLYDEELHNYEESTLYYEKAYTLKDKDAAVSLALLYKKQFKDYDKAIEWFKKAYEQGNRGGAYGLGYLYDVDKHDFPNAIIWYKKAAKKGDATAIKNLAYVYRDMNDTIPSASYLIALVAYDYNKDEIFNRLHNIWKLSDEEIKKAYKLQQTLDIPKHYTGGID